MKSIKEFSWPKKEKTLHYTQLRAEEYRVIEFKPYTGNGVKMTKWRTQWQTGYGVKCSNWVLSKYPLGYEGLYIIKESDLDWLKDPSQIEAKFTY